MKTEFDIAVVGAGIAGATLAAALADTPLRVIVLDRGKKATVPAEYGQRVSALGRAADRVLDTVGVWPQVTGQRACPFRRMQVWDAGSKGHIEFDSARLAAPYLGHIVENDVLLAALHDRLQAAKNVSLQFATMLRSLDVDEDRVVLETDAERSVTASVVVGSDGSASWVRDSLGLEQKQTEYHQSGIVCQVRTELPHRETAWQRFLATGPLAFLPLANGDCSIVWSCDELLAQDLLQLDDEGFRLRLQTASDGVLGHIEHVGPRAAFPLRRAHAQSYVSQRAALIGDAAHTVHPLAGQGANLGIADAASLAEVLMDSYAAGRDLGSARTLRRYERWRKGENLLMLALLDALQKLFALQDPLTRAFRGAGLSATNRLGWLKDELAARAMGRHGDLSRLARGVPLHHA